MNPQDQSGQVPQQQQPTQPVQQPQQVAPVQPQTPKVLEVRFEDDLVINVTPETVNDMRFLEIYEQVSEDMAKIPRLLRFMFGDAQYEGIFKYYEAKGQKFTITKMGEVFEKLDSDLNSNPDFLRQ
jgi:hypothetical protein